MFKRSFLKKLIGEQGEKKAEKYLVDKGYKIVERNMRTPLGEIDIIAYSGAVLVFIEVKMRSSERFGMGLEAVTKSKQHKLIRTARYYCKMKNIMPMCRFDIISIDAGQITHLENAFVCGV